MGPQQHTCRFTDEDQLVEDMLASVLKPRPSQLLRRVGLFFFFKVYSLVTRRFFK